MRLLKDDPATEIAFGLHENKGVFALLLGSGLSSTAGIPTGWAITLDLIRQISAARGVEKKPDDGWDGWYRRETGAEPDYSNVVTDLGRTPDQRRSILEGFIEPDADERENGDKMPTAAHRAIAKLVAGGSIRVVITTNFDRLLENALRDEGIEPTVVSSEDTLAGASPLSHTDCYMLKLHGDYKDTRILNTEEELAGYPDAIGQLLDRIFDEHGLIVCGWSGEWDHALRSAIERCPSRRYPFYWATMGAPSVRAAELISHRAGTEIAITGADSFFTGLHARVEAIERSRRSNPLSTAVLLSSVKRYLSTEVYRIQLDDLLSDEVSRLFDETGTEIFPVQGQIDNDLFQQRAEAYEAISERLYLTAGLLGRWGDGRDVHQITNILDAIVQRRLSEMNGRSAWLGLMTYPALLVFVFYAIGLVSSGRWKALHDLLSTFIISPEHRRSSSTADIFDQWHWERGLEPGWKSFEGYTDKKDPLGRRLFLLVQDKASFFLNRASDVVPLMARYEQLAFICQLEGTTTEALQEHLDAAGRPISIPVAPGYAATFGSFYSEESDKDAQPAFVKKFLDAGFSNGERAHFEASAACHRRMAERHRAFPF